MSDGGKRLLDLDDHWEWGTSPDVFAALFPRCEGCGRRYRRGLWCVTCREAASK